MLGEGLRDGRGGAKAPTQPRAGAGVRGAGALRQGGTKRGKSGGISGAVGGASAHAQRQCTGAETNVHEGIPAAVGVDCEGGGKCGTDDGEAGVRREHQQGPIQQGANASNDSTPACD